MRIIVFGAAGDIGSRVVNEALNRGHEVTAVVRRESQLAGLPEKAKGVVGHADQLNDVVKLTAHHDLIISAVRPPQGSESELVVATQTILEGAANNNIRSLIVGGAASLKIPGSDHLTVLTAPDFLPESVVPIAQACNEQHKMVITHKTSQWSYACPPALIRPGTRTGQYRLGSDELLYDEEGNSHISMEDFSIALIDEAEQAKHTNQRFTAAY